MQTKFGYSLVDDHFVIPDWRSLNNFLRRSNSCAALGKLDAQNS